MKPTLHALPTGRPPHPDVVALAERILLEAKAGKLRCLAVAGGTFDMCDVSAFEVGDGSLSTLVLGLRRVEKRLLDLE